MNYAMRYYLNILFIIAFLVQLKGQSVPQQVGEMVDLFTGDLKYNVPLLNVPGPNGENYPVTLSYSSGIKVDQPASWVGLGWDFNPGEIRRGIKGVPDDFKGETVSSDDWQGTTRVSHFYGPLYFKDFPVSSYATNNGTNTNYDMDLTSCNSDDDNIFELPAYDNYYVDVPGLSGELALHLFDYATLLPSVPAISGTRKEMKYYSSGDEFKAFSHKPQFRFKALNSAGVSIDGQKLVQDNLGNWPSDPTGYDYDCLSSSDDPTSSQTFNVNVIKNPANTQYTGNLLSGSNRMVESNFVVYFTNKQIADYDNPLGGDNENPALCGFLDYKIGNSRAGEPVNAIGAFQVTDANGFVYHFSLPVYNNSELSTTYNLNDDFSSAGQLNAVYLNSNIYVVAWKLTAITGPDFKDLNNNKIADVGDEGFWISFNYGKWSDNFNSRFPLRGLNMNLTSENRKLPEYEKKYFDNLYQFKYKGVVSTSNSQQYYLNTIQSATHTAVFVKSYRKDDFSQDFIVPSLKLDKVMLFRNKDNVLSYFTTSADGTGMSYYPSNVTLLENTTQNKLLIDFFTLKSVDLNYDYSLCKRYLSNEEVTVSNNPSYNTFPLPGDITTGSYSQSGKLTLKKIKSFFLHHSDALPFIEFTYESNNPDYSPWPQYRDIWGYYKSDGNTAGFTSPITNYPTSVSVANTNAWCLKSILSPMGAKTTINYETDQYETVFQNSTRIGGVAIKKPVRIFVGKGETLDYIDPAHDKYPGSYVQVTDKFPYTAHIPNNPTNSYQELDIYKCEHSNWFKWAVLESARGGGVRVKDITITDPSDNGNPSYSASFEYVHGAVSYEPDKLFIYNKKIDPRLYCNGDNGPDCYICPDEIDAPYVASSTFLNRDFMAPPVVGYEFVSIKEDNKSNGKTRYQFVNVPSYKFDSPKGSNTFIYDYILPIGTSCVAYWHSPIQVGDDVEYQPSFWVEHVHRAVELNEGYNLLGKPLRIETYDKHEQLVQLKAFEYKIGTSVQEAFHSKFAVFYEDNQDMGFLTQCNVRIPNTNKLISIRKYNWNTPLFAVHNGIFSTDGATTTFHLAFSKTYNNYIVSKVTEFKDGIYTQTDLDAYDYVRGTFKRAINTSKGNFTSNLTLFTANADMGSKANNLSYKNILNAPTAVTAIPGGRRDAVWSNSIIKRVYSSVDGFHNVTSTDVWKIVGQNVFSSSNSSQSRNTGFITMFNKYYSPLEVLSDEDNYAATKYGYDDLYQIAQLSKGRYGEFTHSSAEDEYGSSYMGGEVSRGNATRIAAVTASIKAHTGKYILSVPGSGTGFTYNIKAPSVPGAEPHLLREKNYMVCVWAYNSNINAQSLAKPKIEVYAGTTLIASENTFYENCGSWSQIRLTFRVSDDVDQNISIKVTNQSASTIYLDDFRLQPLSSAVTGYVYDDFSGMVTYTLDADNFYTRYEHDPSGRVTGVFKETNQGEIKLSKSDYGFKRPLN